MSFDPRPPLRLLTEARHLREGEGLRFRLELDGITYDAFAVRWRGRAHGYLNVCRHEGLPLDFGDGHFFDEACDALVCCHHSARYRPDSGVCFDGPCIGARLTALALEERDDGLWCLGRKAPA